MAAGGDDDGLVQWSIKRKHTDSDSSDQGIQVIVSKKAQDPLKSSKVVVLFFLIG